MPRSGYRSAASSDTFSRRWHERPWIEILPGISSAQILASRAKVCFDETTFLTFHRRGDLEPFKRHLIHVLQDDRNAIVIPRPWDFMPRDIAAYLLQHGISPGHPTEVWENLTRMEAEW